MLANKFITSRHFQFRIWEQSLSQALSFFHASPEQYKDNIVSSISIEYNNRFNFKIPCNPSELFTANEFIPNRFLSNMTPLNYRFDYTEQSRECQNSLYFMYLSIHPTDGHKAIDVNTRAHISLEEDISMSNEIKSDAFLCMANEMNFLIKELFLNLLSTNARAMISMFD